MYMCLQAFDNGHDGALPNTTTGLGLDTDIALAL